MPGPMGCVNKVQWIKPEYYTLKHSTWSLFYLRSPENKFLADVNSYTNENESILTSKVGYIQVIYILKFVQYQLEG